MLENGLCFSEWHLCTKLVCSESQSCHFSLPK